MFQCYNITVLQSVTLSNSFELIGDEDSSLLFTSTHLISGAVGGNPASGS